MKMYNKSDLAYKNGLLVNKEGDVVAIDNAVVDLANELETRIQKARYLNAQPVAVVAPSLNGFKRQSENSLNLFVCETPALDKTIDEAMELMSDIDSMETTEMLNNQLQGYADLVYFVRDDSVVDCQQGTPHRFDVPTLGNPLEWTKDSLLEFIAFANGVTVEDKEINEETSDGE